MQDEEKNGIADKLAKVVYVVFYPLLIPVYGMLLLFSAPTLLGYLPGSIKKIVLIILITNNLFVPLALMPFLRFRGYISSFRMDDRQERIIPLLLSALLYSVTAYIFIKFQIPFFIKSYIFSVFFLVIAATVINFWYKISIHAIAAGGLTALVFILSLRMHVPLTEYIIMTVIFSGLVLSAGLQLRRHSPAEVWTGFLTGVAGMIFILLIF
ncbi:MAG: hypothetical protein RBU28_07180 [Bacteroidales bacterium]|jgi:hypothetical protein|nr:hypothetical protein [Bacteroidales bacterium]